MSDHLVESYDKQLELINSNLVKMGGLVEQQVKDSLKALDDKDTEFAEEILKQDDKIAINRATMTKFGIKVAELTVMFVKD